MGAVFGGFLLTSCLLAILGGQENATFAALLESAGRSVELLATLLGSMTLWGGLMEILAETGDVQKIETRLRKLFCKNKSIKFGKQTVNDVVMNLVANLFGLGNAATPSGVSAAKALSEHGEEGMRALALLLVVNNAGFQLLPTTVLTMRQAAGSTDAAGIWGATLISSAAATVTALFLMRLYHRWLDRRGGGA